MIYKKNWILFSSISYISSNPNTICGCWSVTDRWYKDPLRRGADAKCINRNGAGERKGSWMISLATFWGRSSCGKKRCFLYRLFFIYPIFYSFIIHIVQQTADLFRLVIDCSRDFVGGFHPTSYDTTISSAVLFLPTVYSYGCSLSRIDSWCLRDLLRIDSWCSIYLLWIEFLMFERFTTD